MERLKRMMILGMLALAFIVGVQTSSYATLMELKLYDPINNATVIISDNLAGDISPDPGVITYFGSVGVWSLNVTTGVTYPFQGSQSSPYLDLNSVNASSSSGGTLEIWLTAKEYVLPDGAPSAGFEFNAGGTTSGTVQFFAYQDPSNTYFGGSQIGELGPYSAGSFSGADTGSFSSSSPYSLSIMGKITHTGKSLSSFDAELKVPEASALLLMGTGLVGLWGFKRRFKK